MNADDVIQLHIDGTWVDGRLQRRLPVLNPATEEQVGQVACAEIEDLNEAVAAAERGFKIWRKTPALDRYRLMREAARLFAARTEEVARMLTLENGKPLAQARAEVAVGVDVIDWCAEEARRTYGRVIPARADDVMQLVVKEPVGPVAAFSPWNFPINQAVRKISAAIAAGCSIVLKGPEETPASCAALVQAFADAGVPKGVINLVFGSPADISSHLIPHPGIRKISFTGSTAVGKQLAGLAGIHMKRVTMELGGHAPALVFNDADIDSAVSILVAQKFRNSGQVCTSPTRFLIQEAVFERFVEGFVTAARALRIGDGLDPAVHMGPLAHARRAPAMEAFVSDAVEKGARVLTGGVRMERKGYFYPPTVITDVPVSARIMNEEPFGPIALMRPFNSLDDAIEEANRLPYGLAAYAYTSSVRTAAVLGSAVEAGVLSINHNGVALPETPFGGIKDSGYGSEGGVEAIDAYVNTKFVTQRGI